MFPAQIDLNKIIVLSQFTNSKQVNAEIEHMFDEELNTFWNYFVICIRIIRKELLKQNLVTKTKEA